MVVCDFSATQPYPTCSRLKWITTSSHNSLFPLSFHDVDLDVEGTRRVWIWGEFPDSMIDLIVSLVIETTWGPYRSSVSGHAFVVRLRSGSVSDRWSGMSVMKVTVSCFVVALVSLWFHTWKSFVIRVISWSVVGSRVMTMGFTLCSFWFLMQVYRLVVKLH